MVVNAKSSAMLLDKILKLCVVFWTIFSLVKSDSSSAFVYPPLQNNTPVIGFVNPIPSPPVSNNPVVDALARSISYRLQHSPVFGSLANFVIYQPYEEFSEIGTGLLGRVVIYDPALAKVVADAAKKVGTVTSKLYFDAIGYAMAKIWFNHGIATANNVEPLAQSFANAVEVAACVNGLVGEKAVHKATNTGLFNILHVYGWTSYADMIYLFNLVAKEIKTLAGVQ